MKVNFQLWHRLSEKAHYSAVTIIYEIINGYILSTFYLIHLHPILKGFIEDIGLL